MSRVACACAQPRASGCLRKQTLPPQRIKPFLTHSPSQERCARPQSKPLGSMRTGTQIRLPGGGAKRPCGRDGGRVAAKQEPQPIVWHFHHCARERKSTGHGRERRVARGRPGASRWLATASASSQLSPSRARMSHAVGVGIGLELVLGRLPSRTAHRPATGSASVVWSSMSMRPLLLRRWPLASRRAAAAAGAWKCWHCQRHRQMQHQQHYC